MKYFTFGASVRGSSHESSGKECEDHHLCSSQNDMGIAVLSDGAGSAKFGGIGAKYVTQDVVEMYHSLDKQLEPEKILRRLVEHASQMLNEQAKMNGEYVSDFACTLMISLLHEDQVYTAHIGDGSIVGYCEDSLQVISEPYNGEYVNETIFLTSPGYLESLRINHAKHCSYLALFTDGLQRSLLSSNLGKKVPDNNFFAPLFTFADSVIDEVFGSQKILELLKSERVSSVSDDDKTLVLIRFKPNLNNETDLDEANTDLI